MKVLLTYTSASSCKSEKKVDTLRGEGTGRQEIRKLKRKEERETKDGMKCSRTVWERPKNKEGGKQSGEDKGNEE